jgi:Amt family ammonium transporter
VIYTAVDMLLGLRLTPEEEQRGADLAVHKIGANPEEDVRMGRI